MCIRDRLDIKGCERMAEGRKTLAAMTVAAEYMIEIPLAEPVRCV